MCIFLKCMFLYSQSDQLSFGIDSLNLCRIKLRVRQKFFTLYLTCYLRVPQRTVHKRRKFIPPKWRHTRVKLFIYFANPLKSHSLLQPLPHIWLPLPKTFHTKNHRNSDWKGPPEIIWSNLCVKGSLDKIT